MTESILSMNQVSLVFGGIRAIEDVSFTIQKGELLGLIGPNGAGKTSAFNVLTGIYQPTSGDVTYLGEKLSGISTAKIIEKGIARTFQNIRLFKYMSIVENVMVAENLHMKYGVVSGMLRLPSYWKEETERRRKAMELLKMFDLHHHADEPAASLPYGDQRKLEIVRALATGPKLLLLDEPAAGMNPIETKSLMETISFIRDKFDITILLIEHDMKLVLGICERLIVMDHGTVIATGDPQEVVRRPEVVTAYLGDEEV